MIELPEYLQRKIQPEPNTGCWLWTGALSSKEYGSVGVPGRRRVVGAHRVIYEFYKGTIPEGLVLDHLCRIHCCVNPDHLEPVTHKINILRGEGPAAKNSLKTLCHNGHSLTGAYVTRRNNRACRECNRAGQLRYAPRNKARVARLRQENEAEAVRRFWEEQGRKK